nr:hypothetical protein [Tanacetum cinerariifolium]
RRHGRKHAPAVLGRELGRAVAANSELQQVLAAVVVVEAPHVGEQARLRLGFGGGLGAGGVAHVGQAPDNDALLHGRGS